MGARVVNVTLVCALNCPIDLGQLGKEMVGIASYGQSFPRCVMRYGKQVTLLIYKSGKIVCLADNVETGRKGIRRFARKIAEDFKYSVKLTSISVVNMVGTNTLNKEVDLDDVDIQCDRQAQYNKEIFPNLRYTSNSNPKSKVILSRNGKYILTGVRSEEQMTALEQEFLSQTKCLAIKD